MDARKIFFGEGVSGEFFGLEGGVEFVDGDFFEFEGGGKEGGSGFAGEERKSCGGGGGGESGVEELTTGGIFNFWEHGGGIVTEKSRLAEKHQCGRVGSRMEEQIPHAACYAPGRARSTRDSG